jgi:integrase
MPARYLAHALFRKAVREGLMSSNPCCLEKDEIPRKLDHDREWRQGAVFSHAEAVALISNERIPDDRRTFYGLLFMTGMRFGEVAALRWRYYDAALEPLGRLLTAHSYSTRAGIEKAVKTENPRQVPVHPVLARMLAEWKLGGSP